MELHFVTCLHAEQQVRVNHVVRLVALARVSVCVRVREALGGSLRENNDKEP